MMSLGSKVDGRAVTYSLISLIMRSMKSLWVIKYHTNFESVASELKLVTNKLSTRLVSISDTISYCCHTELHFMYRTRIWKGKKMF